MDAGHVVVRAGRDSDADQLIELIGACWSEYPGVVLDVDGEVPELRAIASHFARHEGRIWVAEIAGRVVGSVALRPAAPAAVELQKLYVAREARRRGLGARLCALVEDEARARGSTRVELWSDTRFLDAHRLYERLGYVGSGETRELNDLSSTVELYFRKILTPAG